MPCKLTEGSGNPTSGSWRPKLDGLSKSLLLKVRSMDPEDQKHSGAY